MGLRHDNPNVPPLSPPRTQCLTAAESRAVIDLWQQERVEQTGLNDRPAVPDVAEGLEIPVEEVQRLLGEVRARRLEEERVLAQEQERSEVMLRLAEEKAKLAEVQHHRAEVRQAMAERREWAVPRQQSAENEPVSWKVRKATHSPPHWVETKPNTWEDLNQEAPSPLASLGAKVCVLALCLILSTTLSVLACLFWIISSAGRD